MREWIEDMAQMNQLKKMAGCLAVLATLCLLAGCETNNNTPDRPKLPKSTSAGIEFKIGELVRVDFSGVDFVIPPHEERVKEDGTITLAQIGSVKAEGKTPGQLQKDIRDRYVPKIYTESFNVIVRSQERFFYVGGEVKANNRYPWVEGMTVVKAIQNAGGFTDYAKSSKVRVTRQDGKTFTVNYDKAIVDPKLDVPIYPDDSINVPRKRW